MGKRFILSWLFSALSMFGISYAWHGIFLNDISHLQYPMGVFLVASIVYLFIGFVLTKVFSSQFVHNAFRNFFTRGLICGAILGLLFYMIALVMGISFSNSITLSSILFDVPWQIFEQAFGGLIVATVYALVYEHIPVKRPAEA
jgi:hypothetical protein